MADGGLAQGKSTFPEFANIAKVHLEKFTIPAKTFPQGRPLRHARQLSVMRGSSGIDHIIRAAVFQARLGQKSSKAPGCRRHRLTDRNRIDGGSLDPCRRFPCASNAITSRQLIISLSGEIFETSINCFQSRPPYWLVAQPGALAPDENTGRANDGIAEHGQLCISAR